MLQTDNIFYTPSAIKEKVERIREKFIHPSSDHMTFLNVFKQWKENRNTPNWSRDNFLNEKSLIKAEDIKKQLKNYLSKIQSTTMSIKEIDEQNMENVLDEIENKNFSTEKDSSKREELILKCLLTGYFSNLARYSADNIFITFKEKTVCKIHPTSNLIKLPKLGRQMEYCFFNEIIYTNREYLKCCTLVRYDMVKRYFDNNSLHV
jgi:HrpA-like RNA helicase